MGKDAAAGAKVTVPATIHWVGRMNIAFIFFASVLSASSAGAQARNPEGCPQPERGSKSAESSGVTTLLLCKPAPPKKLPSRKEAPKKSTTPAETAKALDPTKKAGPDVSEHSVGKGQ